MAVEVKNVRISLYGEGGGAILGFAELIVEDENGVAFRLADIAIKQTRSGKLLLSYAKKKDRDDFAYWNPISKEASELVEKAIFGKLTQIQGLIPA